MTSLLTYMTLAVFVKRSIRKNVRGVREDGGNWWKGGGVGEAVLGGEGEEAADPCRVTLNLPCDAGEISNISLAVMACSASQPVVLMHGPQCTHRTLLIQRVYEIQGSNSCRILLSWSLAHIDLEWEILTKRHCIPPSIRLYAVNAYMPRKPPTHLPKPDYCSVKSLELLTQSLTSVSPPTSPTPLDGKSCNSSALAVPLVQIQGHPSQNPTRIDIIPR